MSQDVNFPKQESSTAVSTVLAPPATFTAWVQRDGAIGALVSIALGFGLLFVQLSLFPDVNLNQWMINTIASFVNDDMIKGVIQAVFNIPITGEPTSPFYLLQFVYAAFLAFPSNLAWFFGALLVSYKRVRGGRDEGNLRGGWDTFWYAMLSIEIPFAIFGVIFLISSLIPELFVVAAFAGSLLLYFLLFFLMPMFWLGLLFALVGSIIGSTMARKK
ncbi:MAG: hypothetical protein Q6373_017500 [Candidatus Sigynarchaeota archaeon]